jgi:hypothetical protein
MMAQLPQQFKANTLRIRNQKNGGILPQDMLKYIGGRSGGPAAEVPAESH